MIIRADDELIPTNYMAVPLARYIHYVRCDECAFWGVRRGSSGVYDRRDIWSKDDRDLLQDALMEAQAEIESIVRYPLRARWITSERQKYYWPLKTYWKKVITPGVEATTTIRADATIDYATEPTMVVVSTTVTNADEIRVQYPASLNVERPIEIDPSDIDLDTDSKVATIYIPRCRMVAPDKVDNPEDGLDYDDLDNFLEVVDVVRVYNDNSTNATLIWPHQSCPSIFAYDYCPSCGEYSLDGCIYVRHGERGVVDIIPAEYSDSSWSALTCFSWPFCADWTDPEWAVVNYKAGLTTVTRTVEEVVVRLAHSKLPKEPCGCDRARLLWKRDQAVPPAITAERAACLFGINDGAWIAWQWAHAPSVMTHRGGTV